jgi:hypothetical protein
MLRQRGGIVTFLLRSPLSISLGNTPVPLFPHCCIPLENN